MSLLLLCLLAAAVYYPGLSGGFIFDDIHNIVENVRLHVDAPTFEGLRQAALSSEPGPLKRPVSMLSFWLNYYTTGLDPFYFKVTNLLIHLLNGLALFRLTRTLLESNPSTELREVSEGDRHRLAVAAAAVWLLHPLNVTGVLYVVQRMTSLSATFVILGLLCYVRGRQRLAAGQAGFGLILFGLVVCGSLAVLAKESGALLPLYMAVIELAWFRFAGLQTIAATRVKAFFSLTVLIPGLAALAYLALQPEWLLGGYAGRGFTLSERVMTEARALWIYLQWIFIPAPGDLGLFHDDIPLSRSLFSPPTTALALVGHVLLLAASIHYRKRFPLLTFATFWYFAGHLIESTIIPLDLVYEHRNYLPMFGPLLGGVCLLYRVSAHVSRSARFAPLAALALVLSAVTATRSLDWSSVLSLRLALVRDHPESAIANYEAGTALGNLMASNRELVPVHYDAANSHFRRAAELDSTNVNALFNIIMLEGLRGQPPDAALLDELAQRLLSREFNFKAIAGLRSLVRWTTEGVVTLPEEAVVRLFSAALDNHTAGHRDRGALLSLLSSYYYNTLGNPQEAVSLALAAVEENPNEPALHLSLADLAIQLGNFELASRQLEIVRRDDRLGRYALAVRALADAIAERT